jgi:hypothetical protein
MKKLILAFVALAFAFAISSCCDQSSCPSNMKCAEKGGRGEEPPYRWDQDQQPSQQPTQQPERQHRRW